MFEKTRGIVLSSIPYDDRSLFVHIYTEKFGKTSYRFTVRQSKKGSEQRLMLTPMTILDMNVQHSETKEVQQVKEATIISSPLSHCDSFSSKYIQYIYAAELINKTVREVEQNQSLWDFIYNSMECLAFPEIKGNNFYLLFTALLCKPLGIGINDESYTEGAWFDMLEGRFTTQAIAHQYYLNATSAVYLHNLLSKDYYTADSFSLNANEKNIMLKILLAYIKLHIPEIGEIKSAEILMDLSL